MARPSYPSVQRRRIRYRNSKGRARPRSLGLGLWLALIAGGGFGGTLAALQFVPGSTAPGAETPAIRIFAPATPDRLDARFTLCHSGGGRNCVVDGDTFWFAGEKYRIADIDTPETHPARCAEEAALGAAATGRLQRWLNDGAFSFERADRDTDHHGRKLRVVTRGGKSVGTLMIDEGLARPWEGRRRPWC